MRLKVGGNRTLVAISLAAFISIPSSVFAVENVPSAVPAKNPSLTSKPAAPAKNLFAEHFFLKPSERLKRKTLEVNGLVFVETPGPAQKSEYALVTDFANDAMRMRTIPGVSKPEEVRKWVEDNVKTADYQGVEIKTLDIPAGSKESGAASKRYFWVGHRAFSTAEAAKAEIDSIKSRVQSSGQKFSDVVGQAKRAAQIPDQTPPVEIKSPSQVKKEEELMLKYLDQMDVGNKLFGTFQGNPAGEAITWQSFGETSWRKTNFDSPNFSDQVGYYTNRIIFRGIRFPLDTINPYIELTGAMESHGADFASFFDTYAGLEWRPFAKNHFFENFRPWSLPLLQFVRNYRVYAEYGDRRNIKDEIRGSKDYNFHGGVSIFYEWGIDPPPVYEGLPSNVPDYIRRYIWGEYYGNYFFDYTNFSSEDDYESFIMNSNVIIGFKLPGIPLPANPINDKLVLMPYMRIEHVNSTQFSFPYQNRVFVGAGVRWMPFASYKYKDNEWLGKTKIFVEYVGVGDAYYFRNHGEVPNSIDNDFRVGVAISQKRY